MKVSHTNMDGHVLGTLGQIWKGNLSRDSFEI